MKKGMSISKYREFGSDTLFKAIYLFKKVFKQEGEKGILDIYLQFINPTNLDLQTLESALFAVKSILDCFDKSE